MKQVGGGVGGTGTDEDSSDEAKELLKSLSAFFSLSGCVVDGTTEKPFLD